MNFRQALTGDYPAIVKIWAASVEHTHLFLKPEDFGEIEKLIPQYLDLLDVKLWLVDERLIGFSATSSNQLEMLFLDPAFIGQGYGKEILAYLIANGVTKVDVNEENQGALTFYQKAGFKIVSRDQQDQAEGNYPILHLELITT